MKSLSIVSLILTQLLYVSNTWGQSDAYRIDSLVNQYVTSYKFSGTILVAKKGKVLLKKGYGYQNAEQKKQNTEETIYNIASLTKPFTAQLILKLQEKGQLSIKDTLGKYYPGYPNGNKITIHHLLTHTSGVYNYTNDKDFMSGDQTRPVTLEQMIAVFKDKPLDFEPGSKFSYSNSGYTLLGYIIEKVTAKRYSKVVEEMIFHPLKMKNTSYGFNESKNKNNATGYQWYAKENYRKANYVDTSISYATGAINSTVEDMYKWHRSWESGFLLHSSVVKAYKRDMGNYGYGWFTDSLYGRQRISHSGNIPGFKSNINRIPADDVCVIALSNANNAEVGEMVRKIMAIVYHEPISESAQQIIEIADSLLRVYSGNYLLNEQLKVTVAIDGKQLKLLPDGQPSSRLEAIAPTAFKVKGENIYVEFIRNKEGKVEGFILFQNGQKIMGKRIL